MTHPTRQGDLFPVQPNLLDNLPTGSSIPSPDLIRQRLEHLLATARDAERLPWDGQRVRVNALLFHNMANWLPAEERDALRAAFVEELTRLGAQPEPGDTIMVKNPFEG